MPPLPEKPPPYQVGYIATPEVIHTREVREFEDNRTKRCLKAALNMWLARVLCKRQMTLDEWQKLVKREALLKSLGIGNPKKARESKQPWLGMPRHYDPPSPPARSSARLPPEAFARAKAKLLARRLHEELDKAAEKFANMGIQECEDEETGQKVKRSMRLKGTKEKKERAEAEKAVINALEKLNIREDDGGSEEGGQRRNTGRRFSTKVKQRRAKVWGPYLERMRRREGGMPADRSSSGPFEFENNADHAWIRSEAPAATGEVEAVGVPCPEDDMQETMGSSVSVSFESGAQEAEEDQPAETEGEWDEHAIVRESTPMEHQEAQGPLSEPSKPLIPVSDTLPGIARIDYPEFGLPLYHTPRRLRVHDVEVESEIELDWGSDDARSITTEIIEDIDVDLPENTGMSQLDRDSSIRSVDQMDTLDRDTSLQYPGAAKELQRDLSMRSIDPVDDIAEAMENIEIMLDGSFMQL